MDEHRQRLRELQSKVSNSKTAWLGKMTMDNGAAHPRRCASKIPQEVGLGSRQRRLPLQARQFDSGFLGNRAACMASTLIDGQRPYRHGWKWRCARGQTYLSPGYFRARASSANWRQSGKAPNQRGSKVRFLPDETEILKTERRAFSIPRVFSRCRCANAYLFRRRLDPLALRARIRERRVPAGAAFHFPGGLKDYLAARYRTGISSISRAAGKVTQAGRTWLRSVDDQPGWRAKDGFVDSYCTFIPARLTGARCRSRTARRCCAR